MPKIWVFLNFLVFFLEFLGGFTLTFSLRWPKNNPGLDCTNSAQCQPNLTFSPSKLTKCSLCNFLMSFYVLSDRLLDKQMVMCPNSDSCTEELQRGSLDDHLKYRCSGTLVACQYAGAGCDFRGPKKTMPKHQTDCKFQKEGKNQIKCLTWYPNCELGEIEGVIVVRVSGKVDCWCFILLSGQFRNPTNKPLLFYVYSNYGL